jgi:hypothetical protein
VARCANVQVFELSGQLASLALEELNCVLVNYPLEPFKQPVPYVLYVDRKLGGRQVGAILSLFTDRLGLGPAKGVKLSVIHVKHSMTHKRVIIPGVLDYYICATANSRRLELDRDLRNHLYPWLREPVQWIVRKVILRLDGEEASYEGTNAISARLVYGDPTDLSLNTSRFLGALHPPTGPISSGGMKASGGGGAPWTP